MSRRPRPIVAIDGPAGAGKSTVAGEVARRLGYLYVDTGAMYRAVALKADSAQALDSPRIIEELAASTSISLIRNADGSLRVLLDGEDVSEAIRSPRVSEVVSAVSAIPGVRRRMVELQRRLGAEGGVVMEGRDIQTVVFPDAEVKIFLTASTAERARRRWKELHRKGVEQGLEHVEAEMQERDRRDSTREDSPMAAAPDAVTIITDGLTIEEVVNRIEGLVLEATIRDQDLKR